MYALSRVFGFALALLSSMVIRAQDKPDNGSGSGKGWAEIFSPYSKAALRLELGYRNEAYNMGEFGIGFGHLSGEDFIDIQSATFLTGAVLTNFQFNDDEEYNAARISLSHYSSFKKLFHSKGLKAEGIGPVFRVSYTRYLVGGIEEYLLPEIGISIVSCWNLTYGYQIKLGSSDYAIPNTSIGFQLALPIPLWGKTKPRTG